MGEAVGPVGGRRAELESAGLSAAGPLNNSYRRITAHPCGNPAAPPKLLPSSHSCMGADLQSTGWSFILAAALRSILQHIGQACW